MLKKGIVLAGLLLSFSSQAAEGWSHIFVCYVPSSERKVTLIFPANPTSTNPADATVIVSELQPQGESVQDAILERMTPSSLSVGWGADSRGQTRINSTAIDFGRSGSVSIQMLDASSSSARLSSNLMELNYPAGVPALCSYFLSTGPRPAVSGSN